jgi:hypothetical protein
MKETYCLPYAMNQELKSNLRPLPKERIILIYGRPDTTRNAFELMMDGICLWQQEDVQNAKEWRIVSVGSDYKLDIVPHVQNLSVLGKLSLSEYADVLSRSAVGISLMLSPHPSYPPLEMAEAGIKTITNSHEFKDLSLRSSNIETVDILTPETIADRLSKLTREAEPAIGRDAAFSMIAAIDTQVPIYSAVSLAERISRRFVES